MSVPPSAEVIAFAARVERRGLRAMAVELANLRATLGRLAFDLHQLVPSEVERGRPASETTHGARFAIEAAHVTAPEESAR